MIPILTVSYSEDLPHLLLQSHSIEKFLIQPTKHYVYIQDNVVDIVNWKKLLEPLYKRNQLILLHDKYHLDTNNGYFHQQYLKLKVASELNDEKLLILDSKNGFYKPIDLGFWFDSVEGGGGIKFNFESSIDWLFHYGSFIKNLEIEIGINCPNLVHPTTPFVFRKATLNRMNNCLNLDIFFANNLKKCVKNNSFQLSEFILYQFFMRDEHSQLIIPSEMYTIYRNNKAKEEFRAKLIEVGLDNFIVNEAINLIRK